MLQRGPRAGQGESGGEGRREGPRPHPVYIDPGTRASLLALLDDGFPRLSERIAAAARDGFIWEDVTEPFLRFEGGEAVCHVGAIAHRVELDGRDMVVGGVHAVATRSDRRRQGLARACLTEAMRWIDERFSISKLATEVPAVYVPHGFRALGVHCFPVEHAGGEDRGRPLRPDAERAWFLDLCAHRDPVSHRFASRDPGWLAGINLSLQWRSLADLAVLDALGAVVDWSVTGDGVLELHDVFARELPPLDDLLRLAPPHCAVRLMFCPDRIAPRAPAVPMPAAGWWMVRGDWPLGDEIPFAAGRLWDH